MNSKLKITVVLMFIGLINCSSDKNKETEIIKKDIEFNAELRAKKFAEEGGGILGDFSKNRGGTTYDFATSNVMWRATLNSLKFMPLQAIDYSGGVISTDWYSSDISSKEGIKITVRFLSDKIAANSIEVIAHKKNCSQDLSNCSISKLNDSFGNEIKEKIMKEVISLNIQNQASKEKK
jgi:hypothetical protein